MSESMLGFVSHGEEHVIPLVALYAALQDQDLRPDLLALADALAAAVLDDDCGLVAHQDLVECERRIIAKARAYRAARQP